MLTPKDVLYLEDVLDQTCVLSKRITHESTLLTTKEVVQCFEKVNKQLKKNYDQLLKLLEQEAKK